MPKMWDGYGSFQDPKPTLFYFSLNLFIKQICSELYWMEDIKMWLKLNFLDFSAKFMLCQKHNKRDTIGVKDNTFELFSRSTKGAYLKWYLIKGINEWLKLCESFIFSESLCYEQNWENWLISAQFQSFFRMYLLGLSYLYLMTGTKK